MANHTYLTDKENKVIVDCGSVIENTFRSNLETYIKFRETLAKLNESDIIFSAEKKKITVGRDKEDNTHNISLAILIKLMDIAEITQEMSWVFSNWKALDWAWAHQMTSETVELIGEGTIDNDEYKDFMKFTY